MTSTRTFLLLAVVPFALAGCTHFATGPADCAGAPKDEKGPKTLFEWAIKTKEEKEKEKDKDKDKDNGNGKKNGEDKKNGDGEDKKNGDGDQENGDAKEPEEEKHLDTDRPHFPEASNTVGKGRIIYENGYTYFGKGSESVQSYPESLLRIGLFADWFEFRISQNFLTSRTHQPNEPDVLVTEAGAQDLVLGIKLWLTEQKGCLPESALIVQTTVPTGSRAFSNDEMLVGVNYDFSWDIVKDCFGMEGVVEANPATDDIGHRYTLAAAGLTGVFTLTRKLEFFAEWYGLFPLGSSGPQTGPQDYIEGGFVYFVTNNMEIDIRAGVGLNDHSADYLLGTGFSVRFYKLGASRNLLVPTLRVGTHVETLSVPLLSNANPFTGSALDGTRSVPMCVPTQSVGTRGLLPSSGTPGARPCPISHKPLIAGVLAYH